MNLKQPTYFLLQPILKIDKKNLDNYNIYLFVYLHVLLIISNYIVLLTNNFFIKISK